MTVLLNIGNSISMRPCDPLQLDSMGSLIWGSHLLQVLKMADSPCEICLAFGSLETAGFEV